MGKGGKTTTREILDQMASVVTVQADRWMPSVRDAFKAFHAALLSRYRTGFMLKGGKKTIVARWVDDVEGRGARAAAHPPPITEAWFVPLKTCTGCGTEVGEASFACRACHSKHLLNSEDPAARKERSRQAGLVRGAAVRARKEVQAEYERRLALLGARERAVAEAEARLVPYRPPTQMRLPFPRRGRGFDGLRPPTDGELRLATGLSTGVALAAAYFLLARSRAR